MIRSMGRDANGKDLLFQERETRIHTVSTLTAEIKDLIEDHFDLLWVEGEISNFRAPSSGHLYMVLKDERAQIRAVMFRPQSRYLRFSPEDGMKVIAQGRIGVYEPRGEYQLVLEYLEPLGVGALALAFEQLKRKLAAQGLFDQEKKRPLPFLPQRVAVITSPTGAAIRDFLRIIRRRFANMEIIILPVRVQGEGASGEMVEALETVNRELDVDVIVLTRGGGSLEDLWAFNQEELAHAIRASRIPVVSAVGHEIDVTISDLAADLRAPTPSAAAELLVVEKEALEERISQLTGRLQAGLRVYLRNLSARLALLSRGVRDPRRGLRDAWMRLDELNQRLLRLGGLMTGERRRALVSEARNLLLHSPVHMIRGLAQRAEFLRRTICLIAMKKVKESRMNVALLEERVKDMSPMTVLKRGYSVTRRLPGREVLRDPSSVRAGDRVEVTLAQGELECLVEKVVPAA